MADGLLTGVAQPLFERLAFVKEHSSCVATLFHFGSPAACSSLRRLNFVAVWANTGSPKS